MSEKEPSVRELDLKTARELGTIIQRLDSQDREHISLKKDIAAILVDLNTIKDFITGTKGGWKAIATVGGVAAAAGAFAAKVSAMITFHAP